jgi:hypothetical protein
MIHRTDAESNQPSVSYRQQFFDLSLILEECASFALDSSLVELPLLQSHYLKEVSQFSREIEVNYSTTSSNPHEATSLNVEKYIDYNYKDMIKEELKKAKKYHAMVYQSPKEGQFFHKGLLGEVFFGEESKETS